MSYFTLISFSAKPNASGETLNTLLEHGPTFRVPIRDYDLYTRDDRRVLPVCGLRDNWVGVLYLDEVVY